MADGKGHRLLAALRIFAASALVARLGNLGRDWLPPTGGLFLPAQARAEVRVEFEIIGEPPRSEAPPILVKVDKAPVSLTEVASKRAGTRLVVAVLRPPSPSRAIELRVAPASSTGEVRITRFRCG